MTLLVQGLPTPQAQALRAGAPDAHGQPPLRQRAQGLANPCRHCLGLIAPDQDMLVLAHRPFETLQPYAEVGPIFLHADDCPHYSSQALPAWFAHLSPALVRGYDHRDWIVYDTGEVVAGEALTAACQRVLARDDVAYAHIRSKFNCFQCRVERG